MSTHTVELAPRDEKDVAGVVTAALSGDTPLDIVGGNTRAGLGRSARSETRMTMAGLSGITLYEPSELVLTARAGTPLETITKRLDQHGQELAFEPIDHGVLLGSAAKKRGTIGGLVAVNAAGPRRIKVGAARDHLLGFRGVNGRGEIFQSGGRVMKNVTGYDMSKLMAGSFGTLTILTEVTLKVLPKAETELSVVLIDLDDATAIRAMTTASGRPEDISALAHVPAGTVSHAALDSSITGGKSATVLRLEGADVSVRQRRDDVIAALAPLCARIETLPTELSCAFWRIIRDVAPFAGGNEHVWRISTAPSEGATLVAALITNGVPVEGHFYDWAGGLIWLAAAPADDAHAPAIRAEVDARGGHATLIRGNAEVRARVPVFHPQPTALAALTARIKRSFDPQLILNRGRMREDL